VDAQRIAAVANGALAIEGAIVAALW